MIFDLSPLLNLNDTFVVTLKAGETDFHSKTKVVLSNEILCHAYTIAKETRFVLSAPVNLFNGMEFQVLLWQGFSFQVLILFG